MSVLTHPSQRHWEFMAKGKIEEMEVLPPEEFIILTELPNVWKAQLPPSPAGYVYVSNIDMTFKATGIDMFDSLGWKGNIPCSCIAEEWLDHRGDK